MYEVIFWDWNGTLIDDCEAAFSCVNEMLDKSGDSRIDMQKYYSLIDTPIIKFYIGLHKSDKLDFAKISREFHDAYERRISDIKLMQGAEKILSGNRDMGIKQAIITSSHTDEVERLTQYYGIRDYFEDIIGASDKNAASKMARALEYFNKKGYNKKTAIMVGDTLHDFDTANALGIDCVLITKGHQGREILKKADCALIDNLSELTEIIQKGNNIYLASQ